MAERIFLITKRTDPSVSPDSENNRTHYALYEDECPELEMANRVDRFHSGTCYSGYPKTPEGIATKLASKLKPGDSVIFTVLPSITGRIRDDYSGHVTTEDSFRITQKLAELMVRP